MCSDVGASLKRLYVPKAFGGIAGLDVDASHVFPQGILEDITVAGSGGGNGGLVLDPGVRQDFPCA